MKRTTLAIAIGALFTGMSGGIMAQDNNRNDTDNADQMTQQNAPATTQQADRSGNATANQTRANDETMDVQVDQEPAEVQVEQESPDITVEQDQPEVTIEQPEPEVTIEQPEPNVTVERAEPNVTVEQSGEPDVNVEQADDAHVDVNQNDDERERNDDAANARNDQNDRNNTLMTQQVSDLEGMTVVNQDDEEIGDIQRISKHNDSGELYAIISVGGIWGFGATDIALPLDEMQFENDRLVMDTTYGSDQIEESSEDYNEDNYTEVDGDMTLSEAHQQ
ncbi:PRC-barrel domain-containing protein [Halomonas aquamarina]|uniref:PRC-barrel domain-containing protein n=1 Tax=Vreelandella aquamarina TaxID=77097 RepID=A0ACC5VQR3_9GAMM|nr:PRC-barrel domain-containing protein [Halomonas aquamarina]MBZ5486240.1 PRC-barrel domain-containing protein [Halomonas aquamarina]